MPHATPIMSNPFILFFHQTEEGVTPTLASSISSPRIAWDCCPDTIRPQGGNKCFHAWHCFALSQEEEQRYCLCPPFPRCVCTLCLHQQTRSENVLPSKESLHKEPSLTILSIWCFEGLGKSIMDFLSRICNFKEPLKTKPYYISLKNMGPLKKAGHRTPWISKQVRDDASLRWPLLYH